MISKYLEVSKNSEETYVEFTHKFPWEGAKHLFRTDPTSYADVTARVEYNGSNIHSIPNVEYKGRKWITHPSVIEVYRNCKQYKAPFMVFFTTNKKDKITVLVSSGIDKKLVLNAGRAALHTGNYS